MLIYAHHTYKEFRENLNWLSCCSSLNSVVRYLSSPRRSTLRNAKWMLNEFHTDDVTCKKPVSDAVFFLSAKKDFKARHMWPELESVIAVTMKCFSNADHAWNMKVSECGANRCRWGFMIGHWGLLQLRRRQNDKWLSLVVKPQSIFGHLWVNWWWNHQWIAGMSRWCQKDNGDEDIFDLKIWYRTQQAEYNMSRNSWAGQLRRIARGWCRMVQIDFHK